MKNYLEYYEILYSKFYDCGKEVGKNLKFSLQNSKLMHYLLELYLIDKDR